MRIKAGSVPPDATQAATASRVFNNNLDGTFADLAPAHGLALADLPVSAVVHDDFDKRLRTVRVGRPLIPDGPFNSWP